MQVFEFDARGHFRYQPACRKSLAGDLVWFISEPNNEYDEYAIKIVNSNNKMLGYVPSEENEDIYNLLRSKEAKSCARVTKIEINSENEALPYVELYISDNEVNLPFKQEEKFSFRNHLVSKRKITLNGEEKSEGSEEDSKNLIIGVIFIIALICAAKLISII